MKPVLVFLSIAAVGLALILMKMPKCASDEVLAKGFIGFVCVKGHR